MDSITSNVQFVTTENAPDTRTDKPYGIYDHVAMTVSNSASGNGATGYAVVKPRGSTVGDLLGDTTATLGTVVSVVLSANGSGYTGTPTVTLATYPLTGTVSNSASATALVGSGTFFDRDVKVGGKILMNGSVEATVATVTDNTHLTVTEALSAAVGSNTYALSGNTAQMVYHGEDYHSGGPALARYFTKPIILATGFDARDLTVYFSAQCYR